MILLKASARLVVYACVALSVHHSVADVEIQMRKSMRMHEGYMLCKCDRRSEYQSLTSGYMVSTRTSRCWRMIPRKPLMVSGGSISRCDDHSSMTMKARSSEGT